MNDLDNELKGVREEISTAVMSEVDGIVEGVKQEIFAIVKQDIDGVKKQNETALKGVKVGDDVSQQVNALQQGLA